LNDSKRIMIAALGSVLILFAWNEFGMPKKARTAPAATTQAAPDAAGKAPDAARAAAPATGAVPGGAPAPAPAPAVAPSAPEELAVLETPEFRATFTSFGGALKHMQLKKETFRKRGKGEVPDEPIDLVHVREGQPWPMSVVPSPELGGSAEPGTDPLAKAPMRIVAKDDRSVTFEGRVGSVDVKKTFQIGARPYQIDAEVAVGGGDKAGSVALLYPAWQPPEAPTAGFFSGGEVFESVVPLCRAGDKTERFDGSEALKTLTGPPRWLGLDQQFFVSALMPQSAEGSCFFAKQPVAGESLAGLRIPVDGAARATFQLYAGPKQVDLLRAYGRDLETAVDYGPVSNYFAFFARILLWVMQKFYSLVHNWGAAIVLLTLLVKALLYPLTVKSMMSMQQMKKLQPKVDALKAKFGDDKEKMNQEVMKLYQEHKVNPLGGCLPLLLQMPVWLALYATLQTSVELYRQPFLWVKDLTAFDPLYILPVTMGASSFIMQKLSPQPADNAQAKMLLYFMPAFFTFIMLKLPAGLTLYILVNNLLSIAQQQWIMRKDRKANPEPA
jgi:YidC/Oxa1 family membrane protein insertase